MTEANSTEAPRFDFSFDPTIVDTGLAAAAEHGQKLGKINSWLEELDVIGRLPIRQLTGAALLERRGATTSALSDSLQEPRTLVDAEYGTFEERLGKLGEAHNKAAVKYRDEVEKVRTKWASDLERAAQALGDDSLPGLGAVIAKEPGPKKAAEGYTERNKSILETVRHLKELRRYRKDIQRLSALVSGEQVQTPALNQEDVSPPLPAASGTQEAPLATVREIYNESLKVSERIALLGKANKGRVLTALAVAQTLFRTATPTDKQIRSVNNNLYATGYGGKNVNRLLREDGLGLLRGFQTSPPRSKGPRGANKWAAYRTQSLEGGNFNPHEETLPDGSTIKWEGANEPAGPKGSKGTQAEKKPRTTRQKASSTRGEAGRTRGDDLKRATATLPPASAPLQRGKRRS